MAKARSDRKIFCGAENEEKLPDAPMRPCGRAMGIWLLQIPRGSAAGSFIPLILDSYFLLLLYVTINAMDIAMTVFEFIVLIFSAVLHEVAHGYEAERLGDPTARNAGRLTLNPIKHLGRSSVQFSCRSRCLS